MYLDAEGKEVQLKSKSGGLYCKNRFSEVERISIPTNMMAFQLGESTQIQTGGLVEATPHSVVKSNEIAGKNISRNTFVVFIEPHKLQEMRTPEGISPEKVHVNHYGVRPIKDRWDNGILFKEFENRAQHTYVS